MIVTYGIAVETDRARPFEANTIGPRGVVVPMGQVYSPFYLKPVERQGKQ